MTECDRCKDHAERLAVLETQMNFISKIATAALTLGAVLAVTLITLYHP